MSREIHLAGGGTTIVDDGDRGLLAPYRWRLLHGYVTAKILGVQTRMHRLILGVGDPRIFVDHINRNPLDNRRANLRVATPQQSSWNRGPRRKAASRFKGVTVNGRVGWRAIIGLDGRQLYLGTYRSETEAARAYDAAASVYFGEFAVLNFPREETAHA